MTVLFLSYQRYVEFWVIKDRKPVWNLFKKVHTILLPCSYNYRCNYIILYYGFFNLCLVTTHISKVVILTIPIKRNFIVYKNIYV